MSQTISTTLASASSLSTPAALPTDLLILLRQNGATGQPPSYGPQNITAAALLASLLPAAVATMMQNLPTIDGTAAPVWNDGGVLTLTTGFVAGGQTLPPLGTAAFDASYRAWIASLATADPHDGVSIWNDGGFPTESVPAGA